MHRRHDSRNARRDSRDERELRRQRPSEMCMEDVGARPPQATRKGHRGSAANHSERHGRGLDNSRTVIPGALNEGRDAR